VEIVLNPLGVPSRMKSPGVGNASGLGGEDPRLKFATPVFDGIKEKDIRGYLKTGRLAEHAKTHLFDGRTGEQSTRRLSSGTST